MFFGAIAQGGKGANPQKSTKGRFVMRMGFIADLDQCGGAAARLQKLMFTKGSAVMKLESEIMLIRPSWTPLRDVAQLIKPICRPKPS